MAAVRVVPGFDVFGDRLAEFVPGLPGPRVEEFSLQRREEALTKRVVIGTFDAANASEQAGHVLNGHLALVGRMRHPVDRPEGIAAPQRSARRRPFIQLGTNSSCDRANRSSL